MTAEAQPSPEPTEWERHHWAHNRITNALSQLSQAASWYERWPADDAAGAAFADNARMMLDGMHMQLEALADVIWKKNAS